MKKHIYILMCLAIAACSASAAVRTSLNYSITADISDFGGQTITGGTYVIDGSAGIVGGVPSNATPAQLAKNGYPGQLYDLVDMQAKASPTSVNEAATRQLVAMGEYDDQTVGLVEGDASWSIVDGPLASIDGTGIATASNVYEDTVASGKAVYLSYTGTVGLVVVNTNYDDYGTYAGDGLDDDWQVAYFGFDNPDAAPNEDPDSDNQSNLYERITGTVPTNSDSYFVTSIDRVGGVSTQANIVFSPAYTSRAYTVEYITNTEVVAWASLSGTSSSTSGVEQTVTDLSVENDTLYYRVKVEYDR